MANAEMRFLRLYNNLNHAIGLQYSVLPPIRSHDHIVYFIIFVGHHQYGRLWELVEVCQGFLYFLRFYC